MPDRSRFRPFTGDADRRIRVDRPPLPLVLCQIRWADLTQLQAGVDRVADEIGSNLDGYPFHEKSEELAITITPEGVTSAPGEVMHQWHSADRAWHIALTRRSVAIFATEYSSFEAFSERLAQVLDLVGATIAIPGIERVGLRHVNRVTDPATVEQLQQILNPSVLGLASLKPKSDLVTRLTSLNQVVYAVENDRLQARSGILAAGETVDPAIPPVSVPSWILDLDSHKDAVGAFDRKSLISIVGRLADINYDFFKMVATDEYLTSIEEKR